MSYNSALTEALNELNGKSTRPQIIKKKIFESKEIKEDSNYKAKVHQAVEKEIKQYLTETLQDFKVITIEVDEYYEKLNEKGRLEIAKSDTLLYKEFEINGDEKVIIEAENTYNELCKKYNVTPTLRPLSHLAFDANLNRKELAKEGKPYYLVSMYMISYAGDIVPYDRYRLKDAAKKESVNESKNLKENFYDDAGEICDNILDTYYLCVDYVNQHKDNPFPEDKKGFLNNYLNKIKEVIFDNKNESVNKNLKESSNKDFPTYKVLDWEPILINLRDYFKNAGYSIDINPLYGQRNQTDFRAISIDDIYFTLRDDAHNQIISVLKEDKFISDAYNMYELKTIIEDALHE